MIKNILFNTSNKVKAIYLLWILINLLILFLNTKDIIYAYDISNSPHVNKYSSQEGKPTKELIKERREKQEWLSTPKFTSFKPYFSFVDLEKKGDKWIIPHSRVFYPFTSPEFFNIDNIAFYDITEFIFYSILPIIIYLIIKLFTTKEKQKSENIT